MNDAQRRIIDLLEKFNNGTASPEEIGELDRWYASFENDARLTTGYSKEQLSEVKEGMFRNISKSTREGSEEVKARRTALRNGLVSVAIFSVFASVFFVFRATPLFNMKPSAKADVMPGKDVAVLTLFSGKQIDLNLAKNGQIYLDKGLEITKDANGEISYHVDKSMGGGASEINTLTTPSGGQFRVVLADGTKVWLNAMSSLTYPSRFSGHKRPVALMGEAYFEVAKNKENPFDVSTANEHVEVLGTHFNINAYADERVQRTTLLEGSVRVTSKQYHTQVTIVPGEQAEGLGGKLKIANVDTLEAAGWKDGLFVLNHTEIRPLMRQLSRWYNIDVVYRGNIKTRTFSGSIDRSYTLLQVLEVLRISKVDFKIEKPDGPHSRSQLILMP